MCDYIAVKSFLTVNELMVVLIQIETSQVNKNKEQSNAFQNILYNANICNSLNFYLRKTKTNYC